MLSVPYIKMRHRQIDNNREKVLQTEHPYLIGSLTTYTDRHQWQDIYDSLIEQGKEPWMIGKARGYRCFTVWYGALSDLRKSDLTEALKQDIHDQMNRMAEFALTQVSEGQLRSIKEK